MLRTCPKCGDYYADALLAFCLVDGTPLISVAPTSESWSEGAQAIEKKENALKQQKRRLKWRRIMVSAMAITTMVVCVVAVNRFIYVESLATATPTPTPTPTPVLKISGRVMDGSEALGGVNIILDGAKTDSTTTDANGNYTFSDLLAGSPYTITPSGVKLDFTPPRHSINNLTKDESADFVATPTPTPTPLADLILATSDSPDIIAPGGEMAYTITVINKGPDAAQSVKVTDNLPSTVTFAKCTANQGGVCKGTGNKLSISFASLAGGVTATITLHTVSSNSLTNGATLNNIASVTSTTFDPKSANNSDTETTTVRVAVKVCSDADKSRERETIKGLTEIYIEGEQSKIIAENKTVCEATILTPASPANVEATLVLPIEYKITFPEACTASVTASYTWKVLKNCNRATEDKLVPKVKRFTCMKTGETWRCKVI